MGYIDQVDRLQIRRYETRKEMGEAVAAGLADKMIELLTIKETIAVIFASAPSQNEFLGALQSIDNIPWERVICFHLDEYVSLSAEAPQSFSRYLMDTLFNRRKPKQFHAIDGLNDPAAECARYSALLAAQPIDIACIGIGENGHIAFNDPHVADFQDPKAVKVVLLDEISRQQQVNDGCFASLGEVPLEAITLTIPTILSAASIYCTVPGERKSSAVRDAIQGPVDVSCPASVLRNATAAYMYLDKESASLL
ncbi:glucosamine-6-phosphate deaminase [Paenibacillus radicis (ex Xue et al. 2023)]|uniref:Glucosamine-6-phosphate deaminase n=1 Tax=Paenibacillus radicis (ex Xue et al. 2023) TaxID=2972489 RepID=A0ABT1YGD6_9BACL|nr:glucosamine-6-phosphate deaminase [Paenibacillus radicis (ex Xue et al. 2023)]MCR8632241.1 glucosamine-6-phosphate deaminase [Paenibacillus radicis (ex Xue et al. 2023)]